MLVLFNLLGEYWKALNADWIYSIDTFPIPVCDNYRIPRARLYQDEQYRGYIASKKRYFYGLKLHLLVTEAGQPVEFFLTPGSFFDGEGLYALTLICPQGSKSWVTRPTTTILLEDMLAVADIHLQPFPKKNSKRPVPPWVAYLQFHYRKMIETTGSLLTQPAAEEDPCHFGAGL